MPYTASRRWKLGTNPHHCSACGSHANQVKTADEWDVVATPPLHNGCHCSLEERDDETTPEPDSPPTATPKPATSSGVDHENPPQSPAPDSDDYTATDPPETPTTVVIPRRGPGLAPV